MPGDDPKAGFGQDLTWRLEGVAFAGLIGLMRTLGLERASAVGGWLLKTLGPKTGTQKTVMRNLAVEFGASNVRVNCIAPGLIQTDFARYLWENEEVLKVTVEPNPMKRIGQPDEIAGTAVYLCSKAAAYVTGQTLVVDGGLTIAW